MQKLDGQLITVFGGGGFLGRYVVQRLLTRGARVRVAPREQRAATFLQPLGGLRPTQFVADDIRDTDRAIARQSVVYGTSVSVRAAHSGRCVLNINNIIQNRSSYPY